MTRSLFDKGVAGAPSLTHQPGMLHLHRGGKKRSKLGRAALFQKDDSSTAPGSGESTVNVNSVHVNGNLSLLRRKNRQAAQIAHDAEVEQINKQLDEILFGKADPYHDEGGRFTAASNAVDPQGSRSQRHPRSGSQQGYQATRAVGEAAGNVAGTYAGRALGSTAGKWAGGVLGGGIGSLIGPEGTVAGAAGGAAIGNWAGGLVGGLAGGVGGGYLSRRIAEAAYSAVHPGFQAQDLKAGADIASSVGAGLGYWGGGRVLSAVSPTAGTLAEITARVLGSSAGDLAGTRFGDYASQRIGGVLNERNGAQEARSATDAVVDAADDVVTAVKKGFEELSSQEIGEFLKAYASGNDPVKLDAAGPTRLGQFKEFRRRSDPNDAKTLASMPAQTRFRTLFNEQETKMKVGQMKLGIRGGRPENFQPRPGEPYQAFKQRMSEQISEQQAHVYPWTATTGGNRTLFGEKP